MVSDGYFGPIDSHGLIRQAYELFNDTVEHQKNYLDTAQAILNVVEKALQITEKLLLQMASLAQNSKTADAHQFVVLARHWMGRLQKIINAAQAALESLGHQDPEVAISLFDESVSNVSFHATDTLSAIAQKVTQVKIDTVETLKSLPLINSLAAPGQPI